jgi:hypothetical protein
MMCKDCFDVWMNFDVFLLGCHVLLTPLIISLTLKSICRCSTWCVNVLTCFCVTVMIVFMWVIALMSVWVCWCVYALYWWLCSRSLTLPAISILISVSYSDLERYFWKQSCSAVKDNSIDGSPWFWDFRCKNSSKTYQPTWDYLSLVSSPGELLEI